MRLHRWFITLLAAGLAVFAAGSSAAPLSGAVSSVGTLCLGSTPTTAQGGQCPGQDVSVLRYFDYINGGTTGLTATPGVPGNLLFLTASGDLTPVIGQTGRINDFSIPGPGDPLSSFTGVNPLWTVVGSDGATYSYVLSSLTAIDRTVPNALDVRGTGTICRNGTDCNLFSFLFTTQNAVGSLRTTFSLSQSGFASRVPEPASLTLLGLGLVGLAFTVRRRALSR